MPRPRKSTSLRFINELFGSKLARNGGVVRRKVASAHNFVSPDELKIEVMRRKYHMVESNGQYIIFCHSGIIGLIC